MTDINNILNDLFRLAPDLKKNEAELAGIVEEMLSTRPDSSIDDAFLQELRTRLVKRARELKATPAKPKMAFSWFPRFAFIGASVVLCVAAAWTIVLSDKSKISGTNLSVKLDGFNGRVNISETGERAFGQLAFASNPSAGQETDLMNKGVGGGGGATRASEAAPLMAQTTDLGISMPSAVSPDASVSAPAMGKMIARDENWQPTIYTYKYAGATLELEDNEVTVLRRIRGSSSAANQIAGLLKNTDLGLANIKSFSGLSANNFSVFEDKNEGYTIYISLDEGALTIDRYMPRWSTASATRCLGTARCINPSEGLKISDIPADDNLIAVANNFLSDHGIKLANYDKPVLAYPIDRTKPDNYAPEIITLTYPLKINGEPVYEEYGGLFGMQVNINARDLKTVSVTSLTTQNYSGSKYEAVKDSEQMISYATNGGWRSYDYPADNAKIVELSLGTPARGFVIMWKYNDTSSEELLVPALIFPVTNRPQNDEWAAKDRVIVPLVKEMLEEKQEPPIMLYKAL